MRKKLIGITLVEALLKPKYKWADKQELNLHVRIPLEHLLGDIQETFVMSSWEEIKFLDCSSKIYESRIIALKKLILESSENW